MKKEHVWVLEYKTGTSKVITKEITVWVKNPTIATFYLEDALKFFSQEEAIEYSKENKLIYFIAKEI